MAKLVLSLKMRNSDVFILDAEKKNIFEYDVVFCTLVKQNHVDELAKESDRCKKVSLVQFT